MLAVLYYISGSAQYRNEMTYAVNHTVFKTSRRKEMYCKNCWSTVDDTETFCPVCGERLVKYGTEDEKTKTVARTNQSVSDRGVRNPSAERQRSVVPPSAPGENMCAILGFIFAFLSPIIGLVLSIAGFQRNEHFKLAFAGMIISILCFIVLFVYFIIAVVHGAPFWTALLTFIGIGLS